MRTRGSNSGATSCSLVRNCCHGHAVVGLRTPALHLGATTKRCERARLKHLCQPSPATRTGTAESPGQTWRPMRPTPSRDEASERIPCCDAAESPIRFAQRRGSCPGKTVCNVSGYLRSRQANGSFSKHVYGVEVLQQKFLMLSTHAGKPAAPPLRVSRSAAGTAFAVFRS